MNDNDNDKLLRLAKIPTHVRQDFITAVRNEDSKMLTRIASGFKYHRGFALFCQDMGEDIRDIDPLLD